MASIFKRGRDSGKRRVVWWISYDDEDGKRRTKKGFTDKRATEDLAVEIESRVRRIKAGLIERGDAKRQKALLASISEHLEAFEKSISHNSERYVALTMTRVKRLVEEAEIKTLVDIEIESIEAVLGEMLESDEIGRRTYNHYVQSMHQFCTWLVPNRIAANPVAGMKRLNADVDIRHPRRALQPEEFEKLVESARTSDESIQCFDGEQRARIYTLSYMTGLRRGELGSLTPANFKLDDSPPTISVDAAFSKHRRKDVLPLHPELVTMLREWMRGMERAELLFPELGKRRTWLMVQKDLQRVGIPYQTDEGIADFHAAGRHTHITELLRNGASLPEARELARHCDIRMTMKYTHIGIEDQARAVSQLPWKSNGQSSEPKPDAGVESDGENWQRHGSGTIRPKGHSPSSTDTDAKCDGEKNDRGNPTEEGRSDRSRPDVSLTGTRSASGDRSDSIPAASIPQVLFHKGLADFLFQGDRILVSAQTAANVALRLLLTP